MHYLYTLVEFQGAPFLAKLTVEEYDFQGKHRAYNVQRIKMSTLSRAQYSQLKTAYRGKYASSVDDISIADLHALVKQYDKEFKPIEANKNLVDKETGKPIKLYHGTADHFNEFRYSEISSREGSFFFAQNREDAEAYAGRNGTIMEVYIRLYVNKEKAEQLATESNSQWFEQLKSYSFNAIIHKSRAIVKIF